MLPDAAVIIADPATSPTANPFVSMEATPEFADDHVAEMGALVPSL
jgi:hypothetical protein